MRVRTWRGVALAAALAFAGVGCDTGDDDDALIQLGDSFQIRVIGKVVDAQTFAPVSANVVVCGVGASGTDAAGNFLVEGIAVGGDDGFQNGVAVTVRIEAPGFATVTRSFFVSLQPSDGDGGPGFAILKDVGVIDLVAGVPLTVIVTKDGEPLANARVIAIQDNFSDDGSSCVSPIVGVTNADFATGTADDGVAILLGLDPRAEYEVFVPAQDLNGDGIPDFNTDGTEAEIIDQGNVMAINVTSIFTQTGDPNSVATNLTRFPFGTFNSFDFPTGPIVDSTGLTQFQPVNIGTRGLPANQDEPVSFSQAVTTTGGTVRVVFETPVDILDGAPSVEPHFFFIDNQRNPGNPLAAEFGATVIIPATATELSGSLGTIYTFTPGSALPVNEFVSLRYFAVSRADSRNVNNDTIGEFYVPLAGNNALTPVVDNYNGSRDGSGGASNVYLEFDEVVQGNYKLLQMSNGTGVTTFSNQQERPIGVGDFGNSDNQDSLSFNAQIAPTTGDSANAGATAGVRYRILLINPDTGGNIVLNDDVSGAPQFVTIAISARDCRDASGNSVSFNQIVTLQVK